MIKSLISKYRAIKRAGFLKRSSTTNYKYAIIGAGEHATTQLYPCIWHIGIPVTRICTKTLSNAENAASRFAGCRGTDKLTDILNDASIRGVFVATPPATQATIVQQLLQAGKSVYAEKPLGYATTELNAVLGAAMTSVLRVGFQRRYAPIARLTKKIMQQPFSYQYRYRIGAYPEGNALYELFIHPIDYCLFLFGAATIEHVSKIKQAAGETFFIQLNHAGIKGSLELSTMYSWNNSEEVLEINQPDATIVSNYPSELIKYKKPAQLFGVPMEKVMEQAIEKKSYLQPNSSIPSFQQHSANQLGFYPAIESFFNATEQQETSEAEYRHLSALYLLLDQLQQA